MCSKSEDRITASVQHTLRIVHDMIETTAAYRPLSQSITAPAVIDSVKLPAPRPLLSSLLDTGLSHDVAVAISSTYEVNAGEFRRRIQESIVMACRKIEELPVVTLASSPDLLVGKVASTFTEVYLRRLEQWKEEIIQRIRQVSKTTLAIPGNSPLFNHDYVPFLEQFFNENPFPTHADKVYLAKKSNMHYRQIHVWFQNRRSRTRRDGKVLKKKPTCEGVTKPLDKPHERMESHVVEPSSKAPKTSGVDSLEAAIKIEISRKVAKDAFTSYSPPHAFPSSYPPICFYDPFPCKVGPIHFSRPEWRRTSCGRPPLLPLTSIDELVEIFSRLNVRDEARARGLPNFQTRAATVAITVVPSRAPHPSLIVSTYRQPANIVQRHPIIRAPVSNSRTFRSPDPTSKPVALLPPPITLDAGELLGRRKTALLPRRSPYRTRNACRGTSPSGNSSTSSYLSSSDSENRSCSFSDISSLSTPSGITSDQELPPIPVALSFTFRQFNSSLI